MTTATSPRHIEHPAREDIRLGPVLHALSDPIRLRIVCAMAHGRGEAFSCSYFALPVTKSTSTHHFRVLRESGVVRQTYQGTAKLNSLRRADLDALFPGLLDSVLESADAEAHRERPHPQ
ncbi:ArsR/SmtB family transcription factor [Streptomyces sp. NPDC048018]|uniref:ArsR/SmtB family transcription factor n=1 Tax=Streptomyces sp. NPDC048018 TaxID=3365499 RepID=UPI003716D06C